MCGLSRELSRHQRQPMGLPSVQNLFSAWLTNKELSLSEGSQDTPHLQMHMGCSIRLVHCNACSLSIHKAEAGCTLQRIGCFQTWITGFKLSSKYSDTKGHHAPGCTGLQVHGWPLQSSKVSWQFNEALSRRLDVIVNINVTLEVAFGIDASHIYHST